MIVRRAFPHAHRNFRDPKTSFMEKDQCFHFGIIVGIDAGIELYHPLIGAPKAGGRVCHRSCENAGEY